MYSGGPLHIDEQMQDDQLEPTYSSPVPIRDITLKTCRKQWTISRGGGKVFGISVLMERRNDGDDDSFNSLFFSASHYWYCKSFYAKFHFDILAVYSFCLFQNFHYFIFANRLMSPIYIKGFIFSYDLVNL